MNFKSPIKRTSVALLSVCSLLFGASAIAVSDAYVEKPAATTETMTENPATDTTIKDKAKGAAKETGRVVSDSWITTKVKSVLLADSLTKGFKISVKTTNRTVALSGAVDTQATIDKAYQLASQVEGVASVDTTKLKIKAN